jgi:uncharacterized membrane protein
MTDTPKRTVAKTFSWRIIATFATFFVSYIVSKDVSIASGIAGTQIIMHTFLYVIHERIWNKIQWGKFE